MMKAPSTDMHSSSDACPPLEDIAAFLDGTLPPGDRARITEHLARCESCYEVFAGAAHFLEETAAEGTDRRGVLPFPFTGEENDRDLRRTSRWLPLAASIVLAAGLGWWAGWRLFFAPPDITLATVIEPIEEEAFEPGDLYASEVVRGPDEDVSLSSTGPEFMTGVHLVDLRWSVRSGDVDATADRLQALGSELQDVIGLLGMSQRSVDEYLRMKTPADLDRFAAELPAWERELEEALSGSLPFQFGLWSEAGRLAALTESAAFFDRRSNRRFLSHLQKTLPGQLPPEVEEPVLRELQAIERTWSAGDLSRETFQGLAVSFEKIIRWIDNSEEDLGV